MLEFAVGPLSMDRERDSYYRICPPKFRSHNEGKSMHRDRESARDRVREKEGESESSDPFSIFLYRKFVIFLGVLTTSP